MPPKVEEPRYTSRQLREAAAGEVLNCIGWAMDCGIPEVYEWGRTLVLRLPMILDSPYDPPPPSPELLTQMLEAGREKMRQLNLPPIQRTQ